MRCWRPCSVLHPNPPPKIPFTTTYLPEIKTALRGTLERHRDAADTAFAGLHASQKRLASKVRALLTALDGVLRLAPPRADPAHVEHLRAAAAGARALQARLRGVATRLDRAEAAIGDLRARGALPPLAPAPPPAPAVSTEAQAATVASTAATSTGAKSG